MGSWHSPRTAACWPRGVPMGRCGSGSHLPSMKQRSVTTRTCDRAGSEPAQGGTAMPSEIHGDRQCNAAAGIHGEGCPGGPELYCLDNEDGTYTCAHGRAGMAAEV